VLVRGSNPLRRVRNVAAICLQGGGCRAGLVCSPDGNSGGNRATLQGAEDHVAS
jgi:hypothetical protein